MEESKRKQIISHILALLHKHKLVPFKIEEHECDNPECRKTVVFAKAMLELFEKEKK